MCVCVCVCVPVHTQEGLTGLQQECETCREQRQPTADSFMPTGEGRKSSFSPVTEAMRLWRGQATARPLKHLPTGILKPAGSPSTSGTKRVPLALAGCHTQG